MFLGSSTNTHFTSFSPFFFLAFCSAWYFQSNKAFCLFRIFKGLKKKYLIPITAFCMVFFSFMVGFWCDPLDKVHRFFLFLFFKMQTSLFFPCSLNGLEALFESPLSLDTFIPLYTIGVELRGDCPLPSRMIFLISLSFLLRFQHHSSGLDFL